MEEDTTPGKLDALARRVTRLEETAQRIDARWGENAERIARIEKAVAENTDLTRDIRDVVVAGKVGGRLIKWAGGIAAGAAAMWAAWTQIGGGK